MTEKDAALTREGRCVRVIGLHDTRCGEVGTVVREDSEWTTVVRFADGAACLYGNSALQDLTPQKARGTP